MDTKKLEKIAELTSQLHVMERARESGFYGLDINGTHNGIAYNNRFRISKDAGQKILVELMAATKAELESLGVTLE